MERNEVKHLGIGKIMQYCRIWSLHSTLVEESNFWIFELVCMCVCVKI